MDSSQRATIRGVVVLGVIEWGVSSYGEAEWQRFVDGLPPPSQPTWQGESVLPTSRVPAVLFAEGAAGYIDRWGKAAYHDATASLATSDLSGYMKFFLRVGTPTFVAKRFPNVVRHYLNVGRGTVETGPGRAHLQMFDTGAYREGTSEGTVGWCRGALQLSGAKGIEVEYEVAPDFNHASYEFRWQ